jgi:hypothetical protein
MTVPVGDEKSTFRIGEKIVDLLGLIIGIEGQRDGPEGERGKVKKQKLHPLGQLKRHAVARLDAEGVEGARVALDLPRKGRIGPGNAFEGDGRLFRAP